MFNGYTVHYGILDPHRIFNLCGESRFNDILLFDRMIAERNKIDNFYNKLEESILKKGFINPILVVSGWCNPKFIQKLPPHMQKKENILICDRNGGSRLYFAQKYKIDIPCIITDFVDKFYNYNQCYNIQDIKNYFKIPPNSIVANQNGIYLEDLPQFF